MKYTFRTFYIPERMMGGIRRYIEHGIDPGHFLTAIIENDLSEAVARADDENMANIPAYVAYFYSEAPCQCWGSNEKRRAWERIHSTETQKQCGARFVSKHDIPAVCEKPSGHRGDHIGREAVS